MFSLLMRSRVGVCFSQGMFEINVADRLSNEKMLMHAFYKHTSSTRELITVGLQVAP